MSILGLVSVLLGLTAVLLLALYVLQRRELKAVGQLSREVQRIAIGGRLGGRVELQTDDPEIAALGTAVNHLIARVSTHTDRERVTPALFADLGDRIHEVVVVQRQTILYANRQFATLVGADRVELVGRRLEDLVAPEYAELVGDNLRRHLAGDAAAARYEVEILGLQGQASRLEIVPTVIDYDGAPALLVTGVEVVPTQTMPALRLPGITVPDGAGIARGAAATAPAGSNGTLPAAAVAAALEAVPEGIFFTDVEGHIQFMNAAAEALAGVSREAAAGRRFEDVVGLVDDAERRAIADPVRQAVQTGLPVAFSRRTILMSRATGGERAIEPVASPVRDADGQVAGAVVLLRDVTELRGLARQMSYQATHDALTGLVNRREFERRLEEALEGARRGDGNHVLCYLDLDRFKVVNDTSGHVAGDSMLREIAKLLRDEVRDSDTVARIGGDEFGVLLIGCPLEKARQIADDMCRTLADYRFVWKDKLFDVGVSIGLVELSRESGSLEESLAAADSACYVAKKQGTGRVAVYSARDEAAARHSGEIQWLHRLQTALKEDRFELYHQPIRHAFGLNGGGPAIEVLLRLREGSGARIAPGEFIRAAERYRLMGHIDRWVVQTTLAALGRGALELPANRTIAINISGQTLGDLSFLEFVVDCFDRTGATSSQVCFEISETAVVANLEHARRFVGVLHGMGCQFALDDFGTGLGSIANLRNLPIDFLKIDGSFMRNLARDSVNQAMVGAMIRLARTLNFKVIAEEIEDETSLDAAREMGVDYVQGFAIARPSPLPMAA
jgi:diguanylate cyclase (GGDEF)-like protein/PAS domain S-box-containing protein